MMEIIKVGFDLGIFRISYGLLWRFLVEKIFERKCYSLTDQMIHASRSVVVNVEGWGKKKYENKFKRHQVYSILIFGRNKNMVIICKDLHWVHINAEHIAGVA